MTALRMYGGLDIFKWMTHTDFYFVTISTCVIVCGCARMYLYIWKCLYSTRQPIFFVFGFWHNHSLVYRIEFWQMNIGYLLFRCSFSLYLSLWYLLNFTLFAAASSYVSLSTFVVNFIFSHFFITFCHFFHSQIRYCCI